MGFTRSPSTATTRYGTAAEIASSRSSGAITAPSPGSKCLARLFVYARGPEPRGGKQLVTGQVEVDGVGASCRRLRAAIRRSRPPGSGSGGDSGGCDTKASRSTSLPVRDHPEGGLRFLRPVQQRKALLRDNLSRIGLSRVSRQEKSGLQVCYRRAPANAGVVYVSSAAAPDGRARTGRPSRLRRRRRRSAWSTPSGRRRRRTRRGCSSRAGCRPPRRRR